MFPAAVERTFFSSDRDDLSVMNVLDPAKRHLISIVCLLACSWQPRVKLIAIAMPVEIKINTVYTVQLHLSIIRRVTSPKAKSTPDDTALVIFHSV